MRTVSARMKVRNKYDWMSLRVGLDVRCETDLAVSYFTTKLSLAGSDSDEGGSDGERADEEREWESLQQSMRKHQKKKFEQTSRDSHPVHAPYFPEVSAGN